MGRRIEMDYLSKVRTVSQQPTCLFPQDVLGYPIPYFLLPTVLRTSYSLGSDGTVGETDRIVPSKSRRLKMQSSGQCRHNPMRGGLDLDVPVCNVNPNNDTE